MCSPSDEEESDEEGEEAEEEADSPPPLSRSLRCLTSSALSSLLLLLPLLIPEAELLSLPLLLRLLLPPRPELVELLRDSWGDNDFGDGTQLDETLDVSDTEEVDLGEEEDDDGIPEGFIVFIIRNKLYVCYNKQCNIYGYMFGCMVWSFLLFVRPPFSTRLPTGSDRILRE